MANQIRPIWTLPTGAPSNTDIIYIVEDPDGTPLERKITLSALASFIGGGPGGGIGGTIAANQVAYGAGTDTIGGNNNFIFADDAHGLGGLSVDMAAVFGGDGGYAIPYNTAVNINTSDEISQAALFVGYLTTGSLNVVDAANGAIFDLTINKADAGSTIDGIIVNNRFDGTESIAHNRGLTIQVGQGAAGTIAEVSGIFIDEMQNTGMGTITNGYGLRIADVAGATANYAIKTGAGDIAINQAPLIRGLLDTANNGEPALFLFPASGTEASLAIASSFTDTDHWTGLWIDAANATVNIVSMIDGGQSTTGINLQSGSGGISIQASGGTIDLNATNGVTIQSLAGTGTRTVVVDANGKLSAP